MLKVKSPPPCVTAHYQSADPARAAEAAPCSVSVWRTPKGVHFVADGAGRYASDRAELPGGRYVDKGEGADSIRTWTKTATPY